MKTPRKTVGYGYVGVWRDGDLGWVLPWCVTGKSDARNPTYPSENHFVSDEDVFYKCRITVELVKGKNGKPIRRKWKALKVAR